MNDCWNLVDSRVFSALEKLNQAGYEAYLVGGCVRDALLGTAPHDYDMTTAALPSQIWEVFEGERRIDTGIAHGTVTVLWKGLPLEITTYRVDGTYSDTRHPDQIQFTRSLREDAARRDFTINAMAWHPQRGTQDFFGGQRDLKQGLIRCVGDADLRFQEDALRILRALRFSSVLQFEIQDETAAAARRHQKLLRKLSPERVSAEFGKLICGKNVRKILLDYINILGEVLPELLPMKGFEQRNFYHCYDVLTHTALVVEHVAPQLSLRLAALFHDCGKPATFTLDDAGQGHFYGHEKVSAALAQTALHRLRFDGATSQWAVNLVRLHDLPLESNRRMIRRRLHQYGPNFLFDLLALKRGDAWGQSPAMLGRQDYYDQVEGGIRQVLAEGACFSRKDLALRGEDLLALGYRGKQVGNALGFLLNSVIDDKVANEKEALLRYELEWRKTIMEL